MFTIAKTVFSEERGKKDGDSGINLKICQNIPKLKFLKSTIQM